MTLLRAFVLALAVGTGSLVWAEDFKLAEVKGLPEGVPESFASLVQETGYQVTGPKGVICEIWLAKSVPQKEDFKTSLFVKYPFASGQLMGVIRLPAKASEIDFRGQELPKGVFSLRYGQQPQDGNHLGTSDVRDFLLACSFDLDKNPQPVKVTKELFKLSGKAAGTTHPAIFLLMPPPEKPSDAAGLAKDEAKGWELLEVNVPTTLKGETKQQPLKIVVKGQSGG